MAGSDRYPYLPPQITSNFRGEWVNNLKQYRGKLKVDVRDVIHKHAKEAEHDLKAEARKYWKTGRTTRTARAILSPDAYAFALGWRRSEFESIKTRTGKTPEFYIYWFLYGSRNHAGNDFHSRVVRRRTTLFKSAITRTVKKKR